MITAAIIVVFALYTIIRFACSFCTHICASENSQLATAKSSNESMYLSKCALCSTLYGNSRFNTKPIWLSMSKRPIMYTHPVRFEPKLQVTEIYT